MVLVSILGGRVSVVQSVVELLVEWFLTTILSNQYFSANALPVEPGNRKERRRRSLKRHSLRELKLPIRSSTQPKGLA